ncbi:hypothetical protein DID75_04225 [Candidatus Marinamargulisbacteria bacterium SCGC AG-410-N11]|nr:hypothetical protein DID75_04225 [Candidatus Marinamargulisbacteria bacterium SCGC AG-410-N11]
MTTFNFVPANGFPCKCYQTFSTLLSKEGSVVNYELISSEYLNQSPTFNTWTFFVDRFVDQFKQTSSKSVFIGHSIGGTIGLMTAIQHRNFFSHLIIIEPALFSKRFCYGYNLIKGLGLAKQFHPLIKPALYRKSSFKDLDSIFDRYRSKVVFKHVSDHCLREMITSQFRWNEKDNHYSLVFPKAWEARIYEYCCSIDMFIWNHLDKLSIPFLVIRAEHSNTLFDSAVNRLLKHPLCEVATLNKSTHIVPFEYPDLIMDHITRFIK